MVVLLITAVWKRLVVSNTVGLMRDMWGVGCALIELVNRAPLAGPLWLEMELRDSKRVYLIDGANKFSTVIGNAVTRLLDSNPNSRMTASELLQSLSSASMSPSTSSVPLASSSSDEKEEDIEADDHSVPLASSSSDEKEGDIEADDDLNPFHLDDDLNPFDLDRRKVPPPLLCNSYDARNLFLLSLFLLSFPHCLHAIACMSLVFES